MRQFIRWLLNTKPLSILIKPEIISVKSKLGRYMIRDLTPWIARKMQDYFKIKKGKVSSFGTGGVNPLQFYLLQTQLDKYEGLKITRYNTYFGRSILTRLVMIPYNLATSEVVIVEDVYRPIKYLKRTADQLIIQTWHALGAFKRFGLANTDNLVRLDGEDYKELKTIHVYDYILDPGLKFREKYLESFAPGCKILEGIYNPRVDQLFDEKFADYVRTNFFDAYPQLREKRLLLYTPTYRGYSNRADSSHLMNFDLLLDRLGEDYILIFKKHPSMPLSGLIFPNEHNLDRFIDLSSVHINELMLVSNILITDYSSTFFEFAMLGKPVFFLAKDLESYNDDRGFYFDYKDFVPGPICMDEEILAEEIIKNNGDNSRAVEFVKEYFGEIPKDNASRFARFIVDFINRDGRNRIKFRG